MNNNKRIARIAALILCIVLVALVIGVASTHPLPATHTQPTQGRAQSEAPTARATTVPTPRATVKPTSIPTIVPTATGQPVIVPAHAVLNNAQLGSTLASFKAKYGIDSPQSDTETAFVEGPGLHQGSLIVTYNKKGIVTHIIYSGPDGWTHKQYVAMMLTWIPADAIAVKSAPDLITYSSATIGNFDERFTDVVVGLQSV